MNLTDQNPADYVIREVARLTEHDPYSDTRMALHQIVLSCAQVIADDIACGAEAWPPTVARYVEARDRYRARLAADADREFGQAVAVDRVFDLGGDNDPPEYQPDEDGDR